MGNRAGMVGLRMIGDNIIKALDTQQIKIIEQNFRHFAVDSIDERDFFAAFDQIGIIAGAVR